MLLIIYSIVQKIVYLVQYIICAKKNNGTFDKFRQMDYTVYPALISQALFYPPSHFYLAEKY